MTGETLILSLESVSADVNNRKSSDVSVKKFNIREYLIILPHSLPVDVFECILNVLNVLCIQQGSAEPKTVLITLNSLRTISQLVKQTILQSIKTKLYNIMKIFNFAQL